MKKKKAKVLPKNGALTVEGGVLGNVPGFCVTEQREGNWGEGKREKSRGVKGEGENT